MPGSFFYIFDLSVEVCLFYVFVPRELKFSPSFFFCAYPRELLLAQAFQLICIYPDYTLFSTDYKTLLIGYLCMIKLHIMYCKGSIFLFSTRPTHLPIYPGFRNETSGVRGIARRWAGL